MPCRLLSYIYIHIHICVCFYLCLLNVLFFCHFFMCTCFLFLFLGVLLTKPHQPPRGAFARVRWRFVLAHTRETGPHTWKGWASHFCHRRTPGKKYRKKESKWVRECVCVGWMEGRREAGMEGERPTVFFSFFLNCFLNTTYCSCINRPARFVPTLNSAQCVRAVLVAILIPFI